MPRTPAPQDAPVILLDDLRLYERGIPHAAYDALRAVQPVYCNAGPHPFHAVTSYELALRVLQDTATYSSWSGGISIEDPVPEMLPFMRAMLPALDPPEHTALRQLLFPPLRPTQLGALREQVERACRDLVDAALERREFDFVDRIAAELPLLVLGSFMGLERAQLEPLRALSDAVIENGSNNSAAAFQRLFEYLDALVEDRRKHPREDYMTLLAQVDVADRPMQRLERNGMLMQLVIGGLETTRSTLSGTLVAFTEFPQQWQALRSQAAVVGNAVEESLRFVTPVNYLRRTTTCDTVLGEVAIPRGARVVAFLGAANRDPQRFALPHAFDLARGNARMHLAFGGGAHFCMGAGLARMQLAGFWTEFTRRVKHFELTAAPERPALLQQNVTKSLRVRVAPV